MRFTCTVLNKNGYKGVRIGIGWFVAIAVLNNERPFVIASIAKQSSHCACGFLDCRAALGMTLCPKVNWNDYIDPNKAIDIVQDI